MISYHVTSNIYLSLEEYYNNGLTPAKAKEIIERINDPVSQNRRLSTESAFINGNLIINTMATNPDHIYYIVIMVTEALDSHMACERRKKNDTQR